MEENHPLNQQKVPKLGVSSEFPKFPGIEVEKRLLRNLAPPGLETPRFSFSQGVGSRGRLLAEGDAVGSKGLWGAMGGKNLSLRGPTDPAVLKILRVVDLLRVVNLLSHCGLLSRRTLRGMPCRISWELQTFFSQRRVRGVVNMGGRSKKTLRRGNSLFFLWS